MRTYRLWIVYSAHNSVDIQHYDIREHAHQAKTQLDAVLRLGIAPYPTTKIDFYYEDKVA